MNNNEIKGIVSFGTGTLSADALTNLGVRGKRIVDIAKLDTPVSPGFILNNNMLKKIASNRDLLEDVEHATAMFAPVLSKAERVMKKKFGVPNNPLLMKVAESPMLNLIDTTATVHNVGIVDSTVEGFGVYVGQQFAWREYANMVRRVLVLTLKKKNSAAQASKIQSAIKQLKNANSTDKARNAIDSSRSILPQHFFSNVYLQLTHIFSLFNAVFSSSETSADSCLLIQAMVFGNYGTKGGYGSFYTRDIVKGKDVLDGQYFQGSFDTAKSKNGIAIHKMDPKHKKTLQKIAQLLEDKFKEIRKITFTVENDVLWIIEQQGVPEKSALSELTTLLSLLKRKIIDKEYLVTHFTSPRLSEILHPSLDIKSVKNFHEIRGGISGATGAAVGKVYFNADRLIEAKRLAFQRGKSTDFILAMPATYAEDVKGIEAGNGVISSEGGYASHAPVVARSLGKVAMVNTSIIFKKDSMQVGGKTIKEGDTITINVPYRDEPSIFLGAGSLIPTNPSEPGLAEFIDVINEFVEGMYVRANADLPKDAAMALNFGARGIGLCRTEHMFFDAKRINIFRSMIIAGSKEERIKALSKLEKFQVDDFYSLFKTMRGYPVTIRLLDAPLHEFLPHSAEVMEDFIKFFRSQYPKVSANEVRSRCDILAESNPMLGHRGVRLAISYPEIYRMQIRAIFRAAFKLRSERISVAPEIMVPLIMTSNEIKAIKNGKRIEGKFIDGVNDIELEVRRGLKQTSAINYSVGSMIELPAAALLADKIASYAEFFSFGTNDLTQTTNGLSRDDFNNFFTVYNEFDLLENNPFKVLTEPVKELLETACRRGRLVRPGIKLGLCGEHGAEPSNIPFALAIGLDYVSCSPYGVPLALLAIAQLNIAHRNAQ